MSDINVSIQDNNISVETTENIIDVSMGDNSIDVSMVQNDISVEFVQNNIELTFPGTQGIQGIQGPQGEPGTTDWNGITNKPTSFPPSAHTHNVSDILANGNALSWNNDESTVNIPINNEVTLQVGQEILWLGRNNTGSTIPNGSVVYASGTMGASGRIRIAPYIADGSIAGMYTLGIATQDIPNDTDGFITHFGKVRGLNTSSYTEGSVLYASPTVAGGLTATEPQYPQIRIPIAFVINSHTNNGTLAIRVPTVDQNASEVGYDQSNWVNSNSVQSAIDTLALSWTMLVTKWDVEPAYITTITGGSVYSYTLDSVIRYRFVPDPYNPTLDAFYSTFDGVTLSGFITSRG